MQCENFFPTKLDLYKVYSFDAIIAIPPLKNLLV